MTDWMGYYNLLFLNPLEQRILFLIFLSTIVRIIQTLILVSSSINNFIWDIRNKTDYHDRIN